MIVRDSIYTQVREKLREKLSTREFVSGDRFLSEREVAEQFSISRITANKALASLVGEGLLEHRRGVGNFVRDNPLTYDLRALVSFTERARAAGKTPSTEVLAFERVPAGCLASDLLIDPEDSVTRIERIRCADSVPVIYERRWVVGSRCPGLTWADAEGSLYDAFIRHGIALTGTRATIRAVNLAIPEARILGQAPGAAAFLVEAVGYAEIPLWVEKTIYRGDAYAFANEIVTGESAIRGLSGQFLEIKER